MRRAPTEVRTLYAPVRVSDVEHAVVYRNENEFASHPFTRGFWETSAGDLICNFSVAEVDYGGDPRLLSHYDLVGSRGGRRGMCVRSEDRGRTWSIWGDGAPRPSGDVTAPVPGVDGRPGRLSELEPIDYADPDVLVSNFHYQYMKRDPLLADFLPTVTTEFGPPENQAFFRVSKDSGRSWSRSVMLPLDGLYSLYAVESSMVRPDGRCLLFLAGGTEKDGRHNLAPAQGTPNRPLVYRSTEDGTTFHFLSFITPGNDTSGFSTKYPRGVVLPSGRILCTVRVDRTWAGDMWTEVYKSDDGGQSWQFLSRPMDFGAPGSPLVMSDGRVVIVYTARLHPGGMRAIVSEDEGLSWGPELILRDDAGSWDIGYPRVWEVGPGQVGTIYYYNDSTDPVQGRSEETLWGAGGVRYIARSIFTLN